MQHNIFSPLFSAPPVSACSFVAISNWTCECDDNGLARLSAWQVALHVKWSADDVIGSNDYNINNRSHYEAKNRLCSKKEMNWCQKQKKQTIIWQHDMYDSISYVIHSLRFCYLMPNTHLYVIYAGKIYNIIGCKITFNLCDDGLFNCWHQFSIRVRVVAAMINYAVEHLNTEKRVTSSKKNTWKMIEGGRNPPKSIFKDFAEKTDNWKTSWVCFRAALIL